MSLNTGLLLAFLTEFGRAWDWGEGCRTGCHAGYMRPYCKSEKKK
jgi:hypothetical protein